MKTSNIGKLNLTPEFYDLSLQNFLILQCNIILLFPNIYADISKNVTFDISLLEKRRKVNLPVNSIDCSPCVDYDLTGIVKVSLRRYFG